MRKIFSATAIAAGLAAGLWLLPATASAAACGIGLSTSDFTFRGADADDCAGPFSGNPNSLADFNSALGAVAGIGGGWGVWTSSASFDFSIDWNGFRFSFLPEAVVGPSPSTGSFWLMVTDLSPGTPPDYPITVDLLLAPKAGNQWAAYVFDDLEFTLDSSGLGIWLIAFNNNNSPNAPPAGLSHMNFLLRDLRGGDCLQDCGPPEEPGPGDEPTCEQNCEGQTVGEPATLALLVLGAAGIAGLRRRRK